MLPPESLDVEECCRGPDLVCTRSPPQPGPRIKHAFSVPFLGVRLPGAAPSALPQAKVNVAFGHRRWQPFRRRDAACGVGRQACGDVMAKGHVYRSLGHSEMSRASVTRSAAPGWRTPIISRSLKGYLNVRRWYGTPTACGCWRDRRPGAAPSALPQAKVNVAFGHRRWQPFRLRDAACGVGRQACGDVMAKGHVYRSLGHSEMSRASVTRSAAPGWRTPKISRSLKGYLNVRRWYGTPTACGCWRDRRPGAAPSALPQAKVNVAFGHRRWQPFRRRDAACGVGRQACGDVMAKGHVYRSLGHSEMSRASVTRSAAPGCAPQ